MINECALKKDLGKCRSYSFNGMERENIMNVNIRLAKEADYEAVMKIMSQVQEMHVQWRPDIYKYNDIKIIVF